MPFQYVRPTDVPGALRAIRDLPRAKFLGGGTNLVDLMREQIEQPSALVDVTGLPLDAVTEEADGSLRIGATVRNAALAAHPDVIRRYPVLSQALLSGASGQLRNVATVGGNILQRTRCHYFYAGASACNKRNPGSGCDALEGYNRMNAIIGANDTCIAVHPSDMCVALTALGAEVELESINGTRRLLLEDVFIGPDIDAHTETVVGADELVTAVIVPAPSPSTASTYRKVRDRASYAFAMVSVAAVVRTDNGVIVEIGLALGGVAPRPWRAHRAEELLIGRPATEESFRLAARVELAEAVPRSGNAFKVELAERVLVSVLGALTEHG